MSRQVINDYLAGAIGGSAGLVVGHPFDTTKVQLQTRQVDSPYRNTWQAVQNIRLQGWSRGFFRGLAFPLFSYGVVNSIFFGVYGNTLRVLRKESDREASYRDVFVAGCVAGCAQLVVACPVDVVKVILQSQLGQAPFSGKTPVRQMSHAFASSSISLAARGRGPVVSYVSANNPLLYLYRQYGVSGLYRGGVIMTLRDVPASGIYFLLYNVFGRFAERQRHRASDLLVNFVSGGLAGVLSWLAIMPMDVVKSKWQADYGRERHATLRQCAVAVYRQGGVAAFFTGCSVTVIRAFLVNSVTFSVYMWAMRIL